MRTKKKKKRACCKIGVGKEIRNTQVGPAERHEKKKKEGHWGKREAKEQLGPA